MPHQCLKCSSIYQNDAKEILKGCSKCSNKSFLYMKKMPDKKESIISNEKKELILKELENQIEIKQDDETKPIIIEIGSIEIKGVGKYEIDINKLMKKEEEKVPIYKVGEGTFLLDIKYLNE
jgi:predicted  nucleic acid-binding Zn-ribbon protein